MAIRENAPTMKPMPIRVSMIMSITNNRSLQVLSRRALVTSLLLCVFAFAASAAVYPSKYDIIYHRLRVTVDPTSAQTTGVTNGSVTTYFLTTAANVTQIGFDYASGMSVGTVTYHGSAVPGANVTRPTNVVLITLPSAIAVKGTLDSITINFSGVPTAAGSPVPSGWNASNAKAAVYTLGESFTGSTWWPCHDSLTDKIDSVDMIVTTPSTYRAAGNGLVTEVISGPNRICTWKTRYRIATYMINFAVGNYVNYQYNITTGGKTLPVYNYLYSADNTAAYKTGTDFIQTILPVYVSLLNDNYPFLNEKYGIADCYGNWGALEVQSMTFCATSSIQSNSTLAHELAHQWFGDKLTTNDWHQVWLNEGFANYFEHVVYPENLLSASSAQSSRTSLKGSVGSATTTYVNNISSANNIFAGSDQPYEKGAMLLSMLRSWIGDTKFFTGLHNYLQAPGLAYDFTSVDSLKYYMQQQTPNDLTQFFNDWINQKGNVSYAVKYQYVTKGVYIQLTQSQTSTGAGYFDMPVPIQIKNSSGLDTTVTIIDRNGVLYNNITGATYGGNTIYFPLSATPSIAPILDPKDVVLADAGSTASNSSLSSLILLPYTNVDLSAGRNGNKTNIQWSLETDQQVTNIALQRSTDAKTFSTLANLTGVTKSLNSVEGTFVDNDLLSSDALYRIRVTLTSGQEIFSPIRSVHIGPELKLTVYPNPAKDQFYISLPFVVNSGDNFKVVVYNPDGQIVSSNDLVGTQRALTINASSFANGLYSVVLFQHGMRKYESRVLKN